MMSAIKSCIGHTEAAAGIAGMVQLAGMLMHSSASAVTHLRHVNPHVAGMLSGGVRGRDSVHVALPRSVGSFACAEPLALGEVASFAFQGTNAHALVGKATSVSGAGCLSRRGVTLNLISLESKTDLSL